METNTERAHTCCFTGHRPEKLQWSEATVTGWLRKAISEAIEDGFTAFISGMAMGVDIWAAETVLDLRRADSRITLIAAVPFDGMERRWSSDRQRRYRAVLRAADEVHYVCPSFSIESYLIRNKWMVDRSSRLLAVFNGSQSGTKHTIDYARSCGVETFILNRGMR